MILFPNPSIFSPPNFTFRVVYYILPSIFLFVNTFCEFFKLEVDFFHKT
nr:MAG TPA: hypothetical protein [Caudoviricetes sp.]